jgi:hypothetical protein
LSSYATSHHLALAPQSGAKDQFYFAVYYITLNSNCEACLKIWKISLRKYFQVMFDNFIFAAIDN